MSVLCQGERDGFVKVCFGYEEMSDKKKLSKLDELIKDFEELAEEYSSYKRVVADLTQERAEVASRIGRRRT